MSRYKVRLVPGGVLPQDVNLRLRLTPLVRPGVPPVTPEAGCCSSCDGWAVLIDDVPASGDFMEIPNAATTIDITLTGSLCAGECIDWTLLLIRGTEEQLADFTATPKETCDGVTIVGAWTLNHSGLMFGVYPTINDKPFCKPVLLISSDTCTPTQEVAGWYSLLDPVTTTSDQEPVEPATPGAVLNESTFPNRAFVMDFSPDVYADWFTDNCAANIGAIFFIINGGDPGAYGDFFIEQTLTANIVFRLVATGANDYTGIQIILEAQLLAPFPNLPVTPQITLNAV